jgi:formate dehydrogenase major subunit
MYPRSMADSDCVVVMGSNMAENHPVAFRWPMMAKVEHGAKLIHVDPRFTRTSAVSDIYAPVRAGSDIAFLGGIITHVINSERWCTTRTPPRSSARTSKGPRRTRASSRA